MGLFRVYKLLQVYRKIYTHEYTYMYYMLQRLTSTRKLNLQADGISTRVYTLEIYPVTKYLLIKVHVSYLLFFLPAVGSVTGLNFAH